MYARILHYFGLGAELGKSTNLDRVRCRCQ